MVDKASEAYAVAKEIAKVWRRGVRWIDGRSNPRETPMLSLPELEKLVRSCPWTDEENRGASIHALLEAALAHIDPEFGRSSERAQADILLGLGAEWNGYKREQLSERARVGVRDMQRNENEQQHPKMWESRERTWRDGVFDILAEAVLRLAKSDFAGPARTRVSNGVPDDIDSIGSVFVGRDLLVDHLADNLDESVVTLITGAPGMGKTSIAVALAQRVGRTFSDGRIQIDFHTHSQRETLTSDEAIRAVLERLGSSDLSLPSDHAGLVSLYRSYSRHRSILLVLDDVPDVQTVIDLLPGNNSRAIVTSTPDLPSLIAAVSTQRAEALPLNIEESKEVIGELVTLERARADSDGLRRLAQFADGLPFALTIIGAKLAVRPERSLTTAADELERRRSRFSLDPLPDTGLTLAAALDWSFQSLSESQRRLAVHLAVLPIWLITTDLIEMIGHDPLDFDQLINDKIVEETSDGVYRFHDLTRGFLVLDRNIALLEEGDTAAAVVISLSTSLRQQVREKSERIAARRSVRASNDLPSPFLFRADGRQDPEVFGWTAAGVNLSRIAEWFAIIGMPEYSIWLTLPVIDLHLCLGEFELAAAEIEQSAEAFAAWDRMLDESVDATMRYNLGERMQEITESGTFQICLYSIRSNWEERCDPILQRLSRVKTAYNFGSDLAPSDVASQVFVHSDQSKLAEAVEDFGETLYVEAEDEISDDNYWSSLAQSMAALEQQSVLSFGTGKVEEGIDALMALLLQTPAAAQRAPSIDVIWSVEPPLISLAQIAIDNDNLGLAISILDLVACLYASRVYFSGHQRRVALWADKLRLSLTEA